MGYQYDVQIQNGRGYIISTTQRLTPMQIWARAEETIMGQFNPISHIMERVTTDEGIQTTEVRKPYGTNQRLPEKGE